MGWAGYEMSNSLSKVYALLIGLLAQSRPPIGWSGHVLLSCSGCLRQPVYVMVTAEGRVTNCKQLKQLKQLETDW